MRVIHFSTYGPVGGAGKAAYRVHAGLLHAGCDSRMVVGNAAGSHDRVIEWPAARERLGLSEAAAAALRPNAGFSPDLSNLVHPGDWESLDQPDVIHLHWIAGFLFAADIRSLYERYKAPIVWTMHDMHPFTGGCHYSHGCTRFEDRCGSCPILSSRDDDDASRHTWQLKSDWLRDLPITAVSISSSSDVLAAKSSFFSRAPRLVIPNGIDDSLFRIRPRNGARKLLRLPDDARIIMFGAVNHHDERKGMRHVVEALEALPALLDQGAPVVILTVGASAGEYRARIPFPVVELGPIADDRLMALAYQASDVFVCPSLEDAGPMMIPEALLCGTPVVGFDAAGFAADLLTRGTNGFLARAADSDDLARGIREVLALRAAGQLPAEQCRASALGRHASAAQAAAYMELYDGLIQS
jgi:Glycosyltransferase